MTIAISMKIIVTTIKTIINVGFKYILLSEPDHNMAWP